MPRNKSKLAIHSRNIFVIDPNTVGIQYKTIFNTLQINWIYRTVAIMQIFWFRLNSQKTATTTKKNKTYKCTAHRIKSHVSIACIMISLTFTKLRSLEQLLELYAQSTKKSKPNENDCKQRCFWYWRLSKKKKIDEVRKHENNENYDRAL